MTTFVKCCLYMVVLGFKDDDLKCSISAQLSHQMQAHAPISPQVALSGQLNHTNLNSYLEQVPSGTGNNAKCLKASIQGEYRKRISV